MIPAGRYLMFGRTGVGKSSLINTISQSTLSSTDTAYSCTKTISKYQFETPSGYYEIWDSPGFCEDENPETDKNYFLTLRNFLGKQANDSELQISLILTVRLGAKRIRSEDFEVVRYLARIVQLHRMPVYFVATGADFLGGMLLRQNLDLSRVQYITMLDAELLSITNQRLCANGFHAAYAVDNINGYWMASWKPITFSLDNPASFSSYEAIIGHSENYIRNWIQYAGHDPEVLLNRQLTDLLNARIYNLTNTLDCSKKLPDLVSIGPYGLNRKVPYLRIETSTLSADIDCINTQIQGMAAINISSTRHIEEKSLNIIRDFEHFSNVARILFSENGGTKSSAEYLIVLFTARKIIQELHFIALRQKLIILKSQILARRIRVFGDLLQAVFAKAIDMYLVAEIVDFIAITLDVQDANRAEKVCLHLQNTTCLLYMATFLAEWVCFPGLPSTPSLSTGHAEMKQVCDWLDKNACMTGSASLLANKLKVRDIEGLRLLVKKVPECSTLFFMEINRCLRSDRWLVSANQLCTLPRTSDSVYDYWSEDVPWDPDAICVEID